ncbi:MAG: hypothetical protein IKX31_06260 [Muribaculaceae bacterium]|nr:hypothetical protein [Muribaculaceae bacterium]
MNTFNTNSLINEISSLFNNIFVAISEINDDIKKILLSIMTTFTVPKLQVAYA